MKNEQTFINNNGFGLHIRKPEKGDKVVSYSQFSLHHSCPKAWKLSYIDKIKESKPGINLTFGTALHEIIQTWLKDLYTKGAAYTEKIDYISGFKSILKETYLKDVETNNGVHFSNPSELTEFFADGVEILKYLFKKRKLFFSLKDMKLIGTEIPIYHNPNKNNPRVFFMGYIDILMFCPSLKKYYIIDLKTSKTGWSKWDKENKIKLSQMLLYKRFLAEQYNVDEEQIKVEYYILRRKVDPNALWPVKRIQTFEPSNGKISVNRAVNMLNEFIDQAFKDNEFIVNREFKAISGRNGFNCLYCPFSDKHDLCNPTERKCE